MAWRWHEPGPKGRSGSLEATRDAAVADAVRFARGGRPVEDAALREVLWRSLRRAGWRVVEAGR